MIVGVVRSGLVEALHPVTAAAVDPHGRVLATLGNDLERPFYARSASKPFQAAVSQSAGAGLVPEELAVACASHGGQPIHVAYVRSILAGAGLSEDHLACPPAWPMSETAQRRAAAAGHEHPLPVFHNCSGKHSGMLRACAASGWPLDYARPDHPLQRRIAGFLTELCRCPTEPAGVDGCGVPAFRTTVVGLAGAFSRLAVEPDLAPIRTAMARFASLTSDGDRREAELARWFPAAVKGGAQGCLGVAWYGGLGVAAKSWSGDPAPAAVAVVELLRRLAVLPDYQHGRLAAVSRPPVLGGGEVVGVLEPVGDR